MQFQVSNPKIITPDRWIPFNHKTCLYEDQRGGKCAASLQWAERACSPDITGTCFCRALSDDHVVFLRNSPFSGFTASATTTSTALQAPTTGTGTAPKAPTAASFIAYMIPVTVFRGLANIYIFPAILGFQTWALSSPPLRGNGKAKRFQTSLPSLTCLSYPLLSHPLQTGQGLFTFLSNHCCQGSRASCLVSPGKR